MFKRGIQYNELKPQFPHVGLRKSRAGLGGACPSGCKPEGNSIEASRFSSPPFFLNAEASNPKMMAWLKRVSQLVKAREAISLFHSKPIAIEGNYPFPTDKLRAAKAAIPRWKILLHWSRDRLWWVHADNYEWAPSAFNATRDPEVLFWNSLAVSRTPVGLGRDSCFRR